MIQIQLLLSNTLHRQLFIVNLLKRYEVGRRASVSTIIVCRRRENVRETCRTGAEKTFAFLKIPLDKNREMVYNICVRMGVRGYSLMVKLQLPKLATRVRFPLPAPIEKGHLRMSFFIGMNYRCEKSLQTARIPSHIYTVGAVCCRTCSAGFRFPLPALSENCFSIILGIDMNGIL